MMSYSMISCRRIDRWWLALLLGMGMTGCAAGMKSAPPPASSQEQMEEPARAADLLQAETWTEELARLDQRLGDRIAAMDPARCDQAGELRDRICALADKLCELAERHPDRPDLEDRCADGRMRCDRARRVVGERCE
jgi:hypothetical protein